MLVLHDELLLQKCQYHCFKLQISNLPFLPLISSSFSLPFPKLLEHSLSFQSDLLTVRSIETDLRRKSDNLNKELEKVLKCECHLESDDHNNMFLIIQAINCMLCCTQFCHIEF